VGGPIIKDKTHFFLLYQYDADKAPSSLGATTRMITPAGFAALSGVPLRAGQSAASRQAVLSRLGFLNDVYSQGVTFRNLSNVLGRPETGGSTSSTNPSKYHVNVRLTTGSPITTPTARYYLNDHAISN
jgi:hypothetical protein